MLIGVPREIKDQEYRVGLTPTSVRELIHHGHRVRKPGCARTVKTCHAFRRADRNPSSGVHATHVDPTTD